MHETCQTWIIQKGIYITHPKTKTNKQHKHYVIKNKSQNNIVIEYETSNNNKQYSCTQGKQIMIQQHWQHQQQINTKKTQNNNISNTNKHINLQTKNQTKHDNRQNTENTHPKTQTNKQCKHYINNITKKQKKQHTY